MEKLGGRRTPVGTFVIDEFHRHASADAASFGLCNKLGGNAYHVHLSGTPFTRGPSSIKNVVTYAHPRWSPRAGPSEACWPAGRADLLHRVGGAGVRPLSPKTLADAHKEAGRAFRNAAGADGVESAIA